MKRCEMEFGWTTEPCPNEAETLARGGVPACAECAETEAEFEFEFRAEARENARVYG